jgi:SAM-dependent methyltransferase
VESVVSRAIADLSTSYTGVMVTLGTRLGLHRAMAGAGPLSAKEVARRAGCAERYVREWLNAQAAGGYVGCHPVSDTHELPPEQAMVLAGEDSPVFVPHAWSVLAQLEAGIALADIGCGHGHSTLLMAEAFPNSRFHGFDIHAGSIAEAQRLAEAAGLADRAQFPVAAAQHAASALAPGGTVMLVEPFAHDRVEDNLSPVGRLYYAGSSLICCAHAISGSGKLVLGAQAGPKRLADVFRKAGFAHFRRATETPFNLVVEVRR